MGILPDGVVTKVWGLDERCELTDLIRRECAHCLGVTLGDEESPEITFGGLLK